MGRQWSTFSKWLDLGHIPLLSLENFKIQAGKNLENVWIWAFPPLPDLQVPRLQPNKKFLKQC